MVQGHVGVNQWQPYVQQPLTVPAPKKMLLTWDGDKLSVSATASNLDEMRWLLEALTKSQEFFEKPEKS